MSTQDEKCPKCGKPIAECTCNVDPKKTDRKITIEHVFKKGDGFVPTDPKNTPPADPPVDPAKPPVEPKKNDDPVDPALKALQDQLAEEKKKREEYEQMVALQAQKDFEAEKAAVLAQVPESKRTDIEKMIGDDPDVLEEVKRNLVLKSAFTPAEPPANPPADPANPPAKTPEEQFKDELEEFLNLADDEEKREEMRKIIGNDPEKLNNAKLWSMFIKTGAEQGGATITGVPQRKPKGKAGLPAAPTGDAANFKDYIDELYGIKRDPSKTDAEKANADRLLDELFMEVIKGINVARRRTGHSLANYQVNQCPECGALSQSPAGMEFENCPACGWTLFAKDARRR